MFYLFTFLFFLLYSQTVILQPTQSSFRIYPSSITQTEPIIAINNNGTPIFFVSAVTINTSSAFKSEGVYISTNYGNSWFGSDTCTGQFLFNHGGDPGVAVTSTNRLVLTHIGSIFPGVYSHYSDDLGGTWSNAYTITNQQTDDKGATVIDDNLGSPFYGRIYTVFVTLTSPFPVQISYSDNGGETWSVPKTISSQSSARSMGPVLVIGKDGKLFVAWASITLQPPFFEDYISFAVSSNGGDSWSVTNNIFDVNGILGTLPQKGNIRVNGLPRLAIDKSNGIRDGWLYIVTTERNNYPAGSDPDIILHFSSNSGITWSEGIRVNQDFPNNGKIQYFPALEIDRQGTINVLYYDDRNTTSDSSEVFLGRSTDGGNSWIEQGVSDHRFKPKPVLGGSSNYQGDYISLISFSEKLYALWMDDYSGIYQIWMKIIDGLPTKLFENEANTFRNFDLIQNYPNPFNESTTIEFYLQKNSEVVLKIYDVIGKQVCTLLNARFDAGKQRINFNSAKYNLISGTFIIVLQIDGLKVAKSILLVK